MPKLQKSPAEVALEAVIMAHGGFNDMTICRVIGRLLNDIGVPTLEAPNGIKFKPIGASTFGSYIYKSGVMMSFNEHHAPFSQQTLSLNDVLKELTHASRYGYLNVLRKLENMRSIYLCRLGKTFEEVYGSEISSKNCNIGSQTDIKSVSIKSERIPEEEMSSYMALRVPYKNSLFSKSLDGETTIWNLMKLVRGFTKGSETLQSLTKAWRRQSNGKLNFPVIYPSYHLYEIAGKLHTQLNDCVLLDFDLVKQGFPLEASKRIRAIVESYPETICVASSFTDGNFWALVAIGETHSDRMSICDEVCRQVERRLEYFDCVIDRAGCRIKQARLVIYDKFAVIKNPTERFVEC